MFEIIREKKRFFVCLLALVIPPFIVVGVWDQFSPNREPVVQVLMEWIYTNEIGRMFIRNSLQTLKIGLEIIYLMRC